MNSVPLKVAWPTAIWLTSVHALALLACLPQFFSWSGVAVAALLYLATGILGINLLYHRTLTHRGLELPKGVEYTLALVGSLAAQGGPISWVATHRVHHAKSDREGDPHGTDRGLFWAHMGWMLFKDPRFSKDSATFARYAPDLHGQAYYRFLDRWFIVLQVVLGLALLAIGGWSWVIWGVFVRLVVTYHITWSVNSAAHAWGYRTYQTKDRSTNNWWVALLAAGEGWHNNHHAFPTSARHGLRRREFDLTWLIISALAALGVAREIVVPTASQRERRAAA
ncbi:MAG TPA: fatty acid desaturase [Candidatus Dormibacteraeota bacterium]|nr:fatty acid desaturase [Candidatus Dormibacteraeota bacterium]